MGLHARERRLKGLQNSRPTVNRQPDYRWRDSWSSFVASNDVKKCLLKMKYRRRAMKMMSNERTKVSGAENMLISDPQKRQIYDFMLAHVS